VQPRPDTYMFWAVTGFTGGKNSTTLMKQTHTMAVILTGRLHFPSVYGPSIKTTLLSYTICARITAMYERSSAGAVMLNILNMVSVDPMPMQLRHMLRRTTSQTALTGV
jgi:hypothetical protein